MITLTNQLFDVDFQQSEATEKSFPENDLPQLSVQLVGREHELVRIHKQLQDGEKVTFLGLVGMPGVGKSELALHYAHTYGHYYPGGICWVDAREDDIASQIVQFARRLGLTPPENDDSAKQLGYCWQYWPNAPQPTLIVIDGVDSYENQIEECCRGLNARFKFLLTSRRHLSRPVKLISIEPPTIEQAVDIFKGILQDDPRVNDEADSLIEICKWVGRLPLAIQLIGSYLELEPFNTITETLIELRKNALEDVALGEDFAHRSAKSAFELSWEQLPTEARCLGCLLSLFAPAPIPWPLVVDAVKHVVDIDNLRAAKPNLLRAHLLKQVNRETVQVHRLLREFFRGKITEIDPEATFGCGVCRAVVAAACKMPDKPLRQDVLSFQRVYLHAEEVVERLSTVLADDEASTTFVSLIRYYQSQGRYEKAKDWAEQNLNFCEKKIGRQHSLTADAYKNAGMLAFLQGNVDIAISQLQKAYKIQTILTEETSLEVASIQVLLAATYRTINELDTAQQYANSALKTCEKVLPETHLDLAEARMTLATVLFKQGKDLSDIESLVARVLTVRQQSLSDNHPDLPETLNLLAKIYEQQERNEKAMPLYIEAKDINERIFGTTHPQTAFGYHNLAKNYQIQGNHSEALELFQKAIEIFSDAEILPFKGWCLRNLAMLHMEMREFSKASSELESSLKILQQCLPSSHPYVKQCESDLKLL